jgi:hypothetical protein
MLKNLITSIYQEGTREHAEVSQIAAEANEMAGKIFDSASQGDMEQAEKLGSSERYTVLRQKASSLSKQLEKLSESDKELANMIAPVIMALQFQDSVRQSLENLISCFNEIDNTSKGMSQAKLPPEFAGTFWAKMENRFTSTDERNSVRRVVYGEHAKLIEDASKDDPFLF